MAGVGEKEKAKIGGVFILFFHRVCFFFVCSDPTRSWCKLSLSPREILILFFSLSQIDVLSKARRDGSERFCALFFSKLVSSNETICSVVLMLENPSLRK